MWKERDGWLNDEEINTWLFAYVAELRSTNYLHSPFSVEREWKRIKSLNLREYE